MLKKASPGPQKREPEIKSTENKSAEIQPNKRPHPTPKPNPHPHKNQKIFIKIQNKIQLLTHKGLAITSRNLQRMKTKSILPKPQNLHEDCLPPPPPNQQKRKSQDFTNKLKMFQVEQCAGLPGPNKSTSKEKSTHPLTEPYHPQNLTKEEPSLEKSATLRPNLTKAMTKPHTKHPEIYKEDPPVPPLTSRKNWKFLTIYTKQGIPPPPPPEIINLMSAKTVPPAPNSVKIFKLWRGKSPPISSQIEK